MKNRRSDRRFPLWYQAKDYQKKLLVLVSILSELFLSLMSSNLMLFSFSSTRHCRAPYQPVLFSAMPNPGGFVITVPLCEYAKRWSRGHRNFILISPHWEVILS
jgi:hypothetical protein